MNNEIKEILDNLKYVSNQIEIYTHDGNIKSKDIPSSLSKEVRIYSYGAKVLLDYITNLQEENENLRSTNHQFATLNTSLRSDRDNYKYRIDKAIEYIKEMCWIDKEYGYCNYGDDLRPEHIVNILEGDDKE